MALWSCRSSSNSNSIRSRGKALAAGGEGGEGRGGEGRGGGQTDEGKGQMGETGEKRTVHMPCATEAETSSIVAFQPRVRPRVIARLVLSSQSRLR